MDWGTIAEATFFLSVAFLAITITVFVFATSLLGLAIERSSIERTIRQEEQSQKTSEELGRVEEQLDKAKKEQNSQEIKSLKEAVGKLERQLNENEKSLASIRRRYFDPFTVRVGVIWPGTCFLLASIFSGVAWSLFHSQSEASVGHQNTPLPFWEYLFIVIAVLVIVYGLYRLLANLRAVEDVSISSEEAALRRMTDAMKTALVEHEAEHKPELTLKIFPPGTPTEVVQGAEFTLRYEVEEVKGRQVQDAAVGFMAPPGFDFITGSSSWKRSKQAASAGYCPNYVRATRPVGTLPPYSCHGDSLTIKAPPKPGEYRVFCRVTYPPTGIIEKSFDVRVTPS